MTYEKLQRQIIDYLEASNHWDENTDEEAIADVQQKILQQLELHEYIKPLAMRILEKTCLSRKNKELMAETCISDIVQKCNKYLIDESERAINLLSSAQNSFLHAADVLPNIGVPIEKYNCFAYYDIFLRKLCSAQELLDVFKKHRNYLLSENESIADTYGRFGYAEIFKKALFQEMPFINQYREFLKYEQLSQGMADDYFLSEIEELENENTCNQIKWTNFTVQSIDCETNPNRRYWINLLKRDKSGKLQSVTLDINQSELKTMLRHAKYYTLSIPIWYLVTMPKNFYDTCFLPSNQTCIHPKQIIVTYLEIENFDLEIAVIKEDFEVLDKPFYRFEISRLSVPRENNNIKSKKHEDKAFPDTTGPDEKLPF